jgi:hypothetical protein
MGLNAYKHNMKVVKAEVCSIKAFNWIRMRKKEPIMSNTGHFFCLSSNASKLYNNDVIIYIIKKKSWEQFLPNFPITTLAKFVSPKSIDGFVCRFPNTSLLS